MAQRSSDDGTPRLLAPDGIDALIRALAQAGYRVIGPRRADDAVVYDDIDGLADLPAGWRAEQEGGQYRLHRRDDGALFGYGLAPQGWKRQLYPPRQKIFSVRRGESGMEIDAPPPPSPPLALIGARACELAAIARQARVFGDRDFADPGYQRRLAEAFIVAVQCGEAEATCFCAAMGSGPEVTAGYDIKLVEVIDAGRHAFVAETATARGEALLQGLATTRADADALDAAARALEAAGRQHRRLDAAAGRALQRFPEHERWNRVAERCLACGNCTMVCPTCFCTTIEDVTDLKGEHAERWRKWDSCFSLDFSYIHGGAVRTETRSRYRQWITHKLSTWVDQFGEAGCVGCGRCITWCPVGIDITEEAAAIAGPQERS